MVDFVVDVEVLNVCLFEQDNQTSLKFPFYIFLKICFYTCLQYDFAERDHEAEYEPDVYELDVGGRGQAGGDADEERGQHKEGGEVDGDDGLKEEGLEVVGGEGHQADEEGGQVRGQDGAEDAALEDQAHAHCVPLRVQLLVGDGDVLDKVHGEVLGAAVLREV